MRIILGFLSGILGLLAGWAGLAALVMSLAGPDRDGGIAMGAFFQIGPIGGIIGFFAGLWLFYKFGLVRRAALPADANRPDAKQPDAATPPTKTRISLPFAIVVVAAVGFLSWVAWYELIRSPYLTHGFMKLDMQFRLPPGTVLPTDDKDVQITVYEGGTRQAMVFLNNNWRGHDGDQPGILAYALFSYKTGNRVVKLDLPGITQQVWQLDLASDPDPTPEFSPFRFASSPSGSKIEMSYRLSEDH